MNFHPAGRGGPAPARSLACISTRIWAVPYTGPGGSRARPEAGNAAGQRGADNAAATAPNSTSPLSEGFGNNSLGLRKGEAPPGELASAICR